MRPELLPTNRDPLRRLGSMVLTAAVLGVVMIIYGVVRIVRGTAAGEEWILAVGCCLLVGAALTAIVQGVLLSHAARIEAIEKRASVDSPAP